MAKSDSPVRWFDSSPEVIQLVVMLYVRYPLWLRNVEDLAFEHGIDICQRHPPTSRRRAARRRHARNFGTTSSVNTLR